MIDREQFREQFQYYDEDVIVEVIGLFLSDYVARLGALRESLVNGDLETMVLQAHSLKGLAGTFAAPGPQAMAGELEEMGKRGQTEGLDDLFLRLESSMHELARDLETIRAGMAP